MFQSMTRGAGRRLAMIGAAAALVLAFSASSAFASVTITSPPGPYNPGEELTVEVLAPGTAPFTEATFVTVAECNLAGVPGERCYQGSGQMPQPVVRDEETGAALPNVFAKVEVQRGFPDFDFTKQKPNEEESETLCEKVNGEGEPCAIVASYYKGTFPGLEPVGSESAAIKFNN